MSINTAAKELKHKPHKHNLTQHSESTPSDEDQSERSEKNSFHISYFISRISHRTIEAVLLGHQITNSNKNFL